MSSKVSLPSPPTLHFGPLSQPDLEAHARALGTLLSSGHCIALSGPLAAGKSVFARALIRHRIGDPEAEVPSPTFTLVQYYHAEEGTPLVHADLYRLSDPQEIFEIGLLDDMLDAICIIEWPERAAPLLPVDHCVHIALSIGDDGRRQLDATAGPEMAALLAQWAEMA